MGTLLLPMSWDPGEGDFADTAQPRTLLLLQGRRQQFPALLRLFRFTGTVSRLLGVPTPFPHRGVANELCVLLPTARINCRPPALSRCG